MKLAVAHVESRYESTQFLSLSPFLAGCACASGQKRACASVCDLPHEKCTADKGATNRPFFFAFSGSGWDVFPHTASLRLSPLWPQARMVEGGSNSAPGLSNEGFEVQSMSRYSRKTVAPSSALRARLMRLWRLRTARTVTTARHALCFATTVATTLVSWRANADPKSPAHNVLPPPLPVAALDQGAVRSHRHQRLCPTMRALPRTGRRRR